jgi:hypothetical protein
MKKLDFVQMEVINGGQTVTTAGDFNADYVDDYRIRWCVVGKWTTGIGLILIGAGVPFACPAAAVGFGIIAGATTIGC